MKQKLALACTLVHEPRVLLLDEPTTGVDPVSRREFWKLLSEFLSSGLTIVMATPYLDEAERCTRVALLHDGRLLAVDTPDALRVSLGGQIVEVVTRTPRPPIEMLAALPGVADVQAFGERAHVRMTSTDGGQPPPSAPHSSSAASASSPRARSRRRSKTCSSISSHRRTDEGRRRRGSECTHAGENHHRGAGVDRRRAPSRAAAQARAPDLTTVALSRRRRGSGLDAEISARPAGRARHRCHAHAGRGDCARAGEQPAAGGVRGPIGRASAVVDGRAAGRQPIVALSGGYSRSNHVTEFSIALPGAPPRVIYPDIPDNYRGRLDVQWPIYTAGRVDALERAARAEREATGEDLAAARADLRLEITRAFWALVTAREAEQVVGRAVQPSRRTSRELRSRLEQGFIPPNDVLSAEAQLSRQRLLAIEAANRSGVSEADLQRLLGAAAPGRIEPAALLGTPGAAAADDVNALVTEARGNGPNAVGWKIVRRRRASGSPWRIPSRGPRSPCPAATNTDGRIPTSFRARRSGKTRGTSR